MVINIGFTGTRSRLTSPQRNCLGQVLETCRARAEHLHHGDCIGADETAHFIWTALGGKTVIHPPRDPKKRAWCIGSVILPEQHYMDRNHTIIKSTQILIACPDGRTETTRSGTWATVRYARRPGFQRPICLVYPDGEYELQGRWEFDL